jgi:hypothetical protein
MKEELNLIFKNAEAEQVIFKNFIMHYAPLFLFSKIVKKKFLRSLVGSFHANSTRQCHHRYYFKIIFHIKLKSKKHRFFTKNKSKKFQFFVLPKINT